MNINKSMTTNVAGAIALLGAAMGLVLAFYFLFDGQTEKAVQLPVLAIGGVIALLVVIALVAGAYTLFNLADPGEALGLPEGSVRAIIALSLIVLFAILTIYLYSDVSNPQIVILANLTQDEHNNFLNSIDGQKIIKTVKSISADGSDQFTIYYQNVPGAGGDFAKQLLVMIGTLMTSVTSFYFASKPGSTITTSAGTIPSAPEPTSVSPREGGRGSTLSLDIAGNNLGDVASVKLVLDKEEVVGTGVVASAGLVKCSVALTADMTAGAWTLKVADKSGRSGELADAITIL